MKSITPLTLVMIALNSLVLATGSVQAEENSQTNKNQATSPAFFSKERWGVSYLNYMNGPTFSESAGGSINHFLTLKHRFKPGWSLSTVVQPNSNFGNGRALMTMGDPYMRFEYPAIYQGESGLKVSGDVRYYAPLGESSSQAKILGIVSTFVKVGLDVDQFSFNYILIPKLYLNTLSKDGQKVASHGHYVSTGYKLSPKVNLDFALYPVWQYSLNRSPSFNNLPAYPGFTVNFTEALAVSPYMEVPLLKAEAKAMSVGGLLSYTLL